MHGANLIHSLKQQDEEATIRFWGGDKMLKANGGYGLDQHIRETSFMGFVEVAANARKIIKLFSKVKKQINQFIPNVVVLIDYPGFNLRMARWLKNHNYKVVYYIVPQVWAWKQKRALLLDKYSDLILTILPFEKEWFSRKGIEVEYVGHPLLDEINSFNQKSPSTSYDAIAILPGSRKQEIQHMLNPMLEACKRLPYSSINIARVSSQDEELYNNIISKVDIGKEVNVLEDNTYRVIEESDIALVSSGTATLETAIIGTPQVVCYKSSNLSYQIARRLVSLKYISLVNLIMDEPLLIELIQSDCNPQKMIDAVNKVNVNIDKIQDGYNELRSKLGGPGASDKAASLIISSLHPVL